MKKLQIISLFILVSIFTTNINAKLVNKKTVERIQFWTMIAAAIDQIPQLQPPKAWLYEKLLPKKLLPKIETEYKQSTKFDYKINPLLIYIPKWPEKLQANLPNNTHFSIHPIGFLSDILASSTEKYEGLLSIVLNGIIEIEKIKAKNNYGRKIDRKDIYPYEGPAILAEKTCQLLLNYMLNSTIKKQRIFKRLLKVIFLTALSTSRTYLFQKFFNPNLKDHLPKVKAAIVDKFFPTLVIEIFGELLQRYIIDDPAEQERKRKKQKIQEKLQEIIAGSSSPHFDKNKNLKAKEENGFSICSP